TRSCEAEQLLACDTELIEEALVRVVLGFGQPAPRAIGVFERDLRVEARGALEPAAVGQCTSIVEHARLENAVVLDALPTPVEAEPPRCQWKRVTEDPEVLAIANLLGEEAEHRLRERSRLGQKVEEVG